MAPVSRILIHRKRGYSRLFARIANLNYSAPRTRNEESLTNYSSTLSLLPVDNVVFECHYISENSRSSSEVLGRFAARSRVSHRGHGGGRISMRARLETQT